MILFRKYFPSMCMAYEPRRHMSSICLAYARFNISGEPCWQRRAYPSPLELATWVRSPPTPTHKTCLLWWCSAIRLWRFEMKLSPFGNSRCMLPSISKTSISYTTFESISNTTFQSISKFTVCTFDIEGKKFFDIELEGQRYRRS